MRVPTPLILLALAACAMPMPPGPQMAAAAPEACPQGSPPGCQAQAVARTRSKPRGEEAMLNIQNMKVAAKDTAAGHRQPEQREGECAYQAG